jgi:arabinofuranan 3-O-arabinosyltransferase
VHRLQLAGICAALTAVAMKSAPGMLVGDTKLDLAIDPARLMSRALHLWDPSRDFGVTQNQNYGYLFPTGPFFWLGRAIGLPAWAVQRLWWSVLLCVAFLGVVRLAGALGIGTRTSRIIGGLAFALSPRILSTIGPISVESLPYCLAPWVLLPLVRGGPPRRAAARSAVAVLLMGAVNAVAVLAALPPAVLWLLTRASGPARRRLGAWWVGSVLLACSWWLVPLLLLGRYSPPFLDYIETAGTTTAVTSLIEVLRGTSDWIAYLATGKGPLWPAGWALLTGRLVIAYTVVVLLGGLAGLLRRDLPERLWLLACLLLGTAAVTAGHLGALSGLLAAVEHGQLDGALAPLRNVHKFDVVLRLPLALGVAHLIGRLAAARPDAPPEQARWQRPVVAVAALAAVVGAALPALSVGLAPRRPFVEVPGYWRQAAAWLGQHQADGRALLVPGSSFPEYLWGSSNDEPLQPLADAPWVVRSAIPLTPAGTIRALDAVERRLAAGQPSPGLGRYLARMGIGFLVVRNDLDYAASGSTRPLLVHAALEGLPDVHPVADFGPTTGGGTGQSYVDEGVEQPYPAVQVYAVDRLVPRAELHPLADALVVSGGPESLLPLADRGLLGSRPVVLSQDAPTELQGRTDVLTDGPRRRELTFGRLADNASPTLTRDEPLRGSAPAPDYLPPGSGSRLVVSRLIGARAVSASSSASDVTAFGPVDPTAPPYAAVDGDRGTAWRSDPVKGVAGASWRITFDAPRRLAGLTVLVVGRERPRALRVSGDRTGMTVLVPPSGLVRADLPGTSSQLRLTAVGGPALGSLALAEVSLPGLHVRRTLDLPPVAGTPVIALDAAPGERRGCYPVADERVACSSSLARRGEDSAGLDRTLDVRGGGSYTLEAQARPVPGEALDRLLDAGASAAVTASSSGTRDPAARPGAAYDGDPRTGWRAAPGDEDPTLRLRFPSPERVTGVGVVVARSLAASRPDRVSVELPGGGRAELDLSGDGRAALPVPLVTRELVLHLSSVAVSATTDPYDGIRRILPVGVSELTVAGAPAAVRPRGPIRVGCDAGPVVAVGGARVRTALLAARADVLDGAALPLTLCDSAPVAVRGRTEVIARSTGTLEPAALTLTPVGYAPAPVSGGPLDIGRWGSTRREVRVPARSGVAVLAVHENTNPGWTASVDGRPLRPVVLDGWQQGWLVPAGAAGTVRLTYGPDRSYRLSLLVGALLALLLLLLAALPGRRMAVTTARSPSLLDVLLLAGVLGLIAGPLPVLLCLPAAVLVRRLPDRRLLTAVGLAAVAAAGLLLVLHPWGTPHYAGRGWPAQALCATGLVVVWSTLVRGAGTRTTGAVRQVMSGRSRKR